MHLVFLVNKTYCASQFFLFYAKLKINLAWPHHLKKVLQIFVKNLGYNKIYISKKRFP